MIKDLQPIQTADNDSGNNSASAGTMLIRFSEQPFEMVLYELFGEAEKYFVF
jgi:hypothetical protein